MLRQKFIRHLLLIGLVVNNCFFTGCATTKVVTENDCTDAANIVAFKTVRHYFWGLKQAADIKPGCDQRFNHLNGVTVKTTPGNILLSVVTLGIVIPQKISWCCAPYNPTPGSTLGKKP